MSPVEKDKEYTVNIESVSSDGSGVARVDGFTVFVPYTVGGDTARIRVVEVKKRFACGELVRILSPSSLRRNDGCKAYGRCGGCQLRHVEYGAQLDIKRNIIESAVRRIGGFADFSLDEMIGMARPERYRNKMIFHVNAFECGFFAQKSHDIIPIDDCEIGFEENKAIISALREHLGGSIRVFTRKAFKTGEIMVVLSAKSEIKNADAIVGSLRAFDENIVSIVADVNGKKKTLFGKASIKEELCGVRFDISPDSFFQVNPLQTEKLYMRALEYADLKGNESVLDIYCGIGTITLCAAKMAKRAVGVEYVERAVLDAKKNAALNGIKNASFYAGAAEDVVPKLITEREGFEVVILDPPRKGSDERTLGAIVKAVPERIVYVSCNPATLARDARFLADNGYVITRSCGVDLFPHTAHVETVMLLSKINAD